MLEAIFIWGHWKAKSSLEWDCPSPTCCSQEAPFSVILCQVSITFCFMFFSPKDQEGTIYLWAGWRQAPSGRKASKPSMILWPLSTLSMSPAEQLKVVGGENIWGPSLHFITINRFVSVKLFRWILGVSWAIVFLFRYGSTQANKSISQNHGEKKSQFPLALLNVKALVKEQKWHSNKEQCHRLTRSDTGQKSMPIRGPCQPSQPLYPPVLMAVNEGTNSLLLLALQQCTCFYKSATIYKITNPLKENPPEFPVLFIYLIIVYATSPPRLCMAKAANDYKYKRVS